MLLQTHRQWLLLVLVVALTCFLWYFLPCALTIAYNYCWWTLLSSRVSYALPETVPAASSNAPVPKILHQTWRDKNLPARWRAAQQSCIDAHPGYEYRLWTDDDAEQLIASHYPWFLSTFKSYPYSIQRADALRYFVLHRFGGIYLDLDVECLKSLDYLRYVNFSAPKTYPIGISNDVLVSRPQDHFALRLITNLPQWNKWLFVKYVTVMFTTGPMFVTVQYSLHSHKADVAVIPPVVYGKYEVTPDAYLRHLHGSSWHGKDAKYVFWLEQYGIVAGVVGCVVPVSLVLALVVYKRQMARGRLSQLLAVLPAKPKQTGSLAMGKV
ncbi:nucleotide-diphospho-sugar transferase [Haematococcus lacustris]